MSWPLVKLSDVSVVNPRCPKDIDGSQEVTFLAMASVSEDGRLLNQEPRILDETKKGFTYFERNDVVLAKITPCFENGKAAYLDKLNTRVGFGSTEFHVLRPEPEKLDGKYLFYLLWNPKFRHLGERNMSGSAGQKRVPTNFLKNLEIPLPPLSEQKRIAAILDKADQLRQKRQQAIALADDFLRSVFLDMFGDLAFNPYDYQRVSLDSLSVNDGIKCGPFGTQLGKHEYLAEGVPLWGIKHVNRDFKVETDEYLSAPKAIALKAYSIRPDDIVMTRKGTVGNCHVYPEHMPEGIMHSDLLRIRVDESIIDPYFLSWQLKLSRDVSHQISLISSGAIMAGINVTKLKNIEVYVPEVTQQIKFREILFKKGELTQKYSQGDLALFDALSQKAFAGEL
ncbi:restriction endonuclease subunit S [Endozoicomonas sp. ALC013]|uniref:restriction endonuclease subunit S n=1 Tax=Endozoicomonas sp. ALC013 TaxID=3403076 RepID=UPI003BB75D44